MPVEEGAEEEAGVGTQKRCSPSWLIPSGTPRASTTLATTPQPSSSKVAVPSSSGRKIPVSMFPPGPGSSPVARPVRTSLEG